ncbi:MAG: hypothetical protein KKA84_12080 [Bacteroidetes bacterium]|nr:hypothetical protein [Bacteroidota bacterium]
MSAKTLFAGGALGTLMLERRNVLMDPNFTRELHTDITPYTTAIMHGNTKTGIPDPMFKMFEHRTGVLKMQFQVTSNVTIPADRTASADVTIKDGTTLGLAGEKNNTADDSYKNFTFDVWSKDGVKKGGAYLLSVTDGTKVKFKLTSPIAIVLANDDYFVVTGNANGEGGYSREAWADELTLVQNQCQIFETPVEVTGTLYEAALKGYSNELARLRKDKQMLHSLQKEDTWLKGWSPLGTNMSGANSFVDGKLTDSDGKVVRTTMGFIPIVETYGSDSGDNQNRFSINGAAYDYSNSVDQFEKIFTNSADGDTKFGFSGRGALGFWSKLLAASRVAGGAGWDIELSDKKRNKLGFNVRILSTPHGDLHLTPTKALRGNYNQTICIPDMANIFHATYRASRFDHNIKTDNGYDGVKDRYFSDEGVGMTLIENHQIMTIKQGA